MNEEITKHVSPDGQLTFLVIRSGGDISLGFEDQPSHTHGDILAALTGLTIEEAVTQFVDDLLQNRSVIAIATVGGAVRDVWVVDDIEGLFSSKYKPDNETIALRYWNGKPYSPEIEQISS